MYNFIISLLIFSSNLTVLQIFVPGENLVPYLLQNGLQEIKRYDRNKGLLEGVCDKKIIDFLEKNGIDYITKIPDLGEDFKNKMQNKINFGPYYTYSEAVNALNTIHNNFPNLTTPPLNIGTTWENRIIYAMKISDNPTQNENEPSVLLTGVHHAREPIGCSIVLEFAKYLLNNYGVDPDITWLIDNRELWIVPVVNPDGYVYNETYSSGMWRKNRRNNGGGIYGVDLNRNYGYMWGYDNNGSSPYPSDETYRGPYPFSEPETQAIRELCDSIKPVIALNYHSWSNLLLFPWGYDTYYTPDDALFRAMSIEMTKRSGYEYGTAWELLYTANGDSDDWMYGEQNEKPKILAFTPEVGENFWQPDTNIIKEQIDENLPMNMFVLKAAGHFITIDSFKFVDQNGERIINRKDTINLTFWLRNWGVNGNLTNVTGLLKSTGTCAKVIDSLINFPDIPAFPGNSVSNSIPFKLVVHDSFPDSSALPLNLTIQGNPGFSRAYNFYISNPRTPIILFYDGFETGLSNWIQGGTPQTWQRTTNNPHSGSYCLTDSPNGNYGDNINTWIRTASPIDLNINVDSIKLIFWTRYSIESGWDYAYVEVSTNGSTWNSLISFTGSQTTWKKIVLDLTPYKGNQIYIRFRLWSDTSTNYDGIYIDDVSLIAKIPYFADCPQISVYEKGSDILRESVYPEVKTIKFFSIKAKISDEYKIKIFDVNGRKIKEDFVYLKKGEEYRFKPSVKGVYFFKIETKLFNKKGKFIAD
ncbi:MAG: M14 family zinc carboxypeptidase [candidate division WOR-3 bacterium]